MHCPTQSPQRQISLLYPATAPLHYGLNLAQSSLRCTPQSKEKEETLLLGCSKWSLCHAFVLVTGTIRGTCMAICACVRL